MTSYTERDTEQWITIPPNTANTLLNSITMATVTSNNPETKETVPEVQNEHQHCSTDSKTTTDAKENETNKKDKDPKPQLNRADTADSWLLASDVDDYVPRSRSRPRRRAPPHQRNQFYSPYRGPNNIIQEMAPQVIMLHSSNKLLTSVNTYDGVADLTYPARNSVYMTTFPFSGKDVNKWRWLFHAVAASSSAMEGEWIPEPPKKSAPTPSGAEIENDFDLGLDDNFIEYDRYGPIDRRCVRRVRDRSPYYEPINSDIPQILLSRVLDASVIPEAGDENEDVKDVRFWIVVKSRMRNKQAKLLVAESRKAAGMLCFYEALNGNSVMFVGAVVCPCKLVKKEKGEKIKVMKAENLEEARKMRDDDGVFGVVC